MIQHQFRRRIHRSCAVPYSVGVDPVSHRALVAFASTNVGLVVNLDPTATPACLPFAPQAPYCPIAYVTLATGSNPQVAFESVRG